MPKCCRTLIIMSGFPFDLGLIQEFCLKFAIIHPDLLTGRKRGNGYFKNWFSIKLLRALCLAASLFQQEGYFFHIAGSSSEESEWNRVASRLWTRCRDTKRQKRRGNSQQREGALPLCLTVGFELPGEKDYWELVFFPCLLGYHPTQGSRCCSWFSSCVDAACARFPKIPELNTCARDELHSYSEAYERIGRHLAAQRSSLNTTEPARFDTDQKGVFWVIPRHSCSDWPCLPSTGPEIEAHVRSDW